MEIQLLDQHFQIYDDRFEYAKVCRIRWAPEEKTRRFFLLPVARVGMYQLTIDFVEGPPVQLGTGGLPTQWPTYHGLGIQEFRVLCESMKHLLTATRDTRLAHYRAELKRSGYFEYDDKMFFADGTVDRNGRRYTLDLKTPAKAIDTHTEIKCLPRGSIEIRTDWDRDCFHILLNDLHRRHSAP